MRLTSDPARSPVRDKNERSDRPDPLRRLSRPAEHDLSPDECAALARSCSRARRPLRRSTAAAPGRSSSSGATTTPRRWLNTWWEPRDTGFHDHGGSCVGVHVLEGTPEPRRSSSAARGASRDYGPASRSRSPATGIHRMEHEPGAVTIHVYSPAAQRDRALRRRRRRAAQARRGQPDEISPPSPALTASLSPEGSSRRPRRARPRT